MSVLDLDTDLEIARIDSHFSRIKRIIESEETTDYISLADDLFEVIGNYHVSSSTEKGEEFYKEIRYNFSIKLYKYICEKYKNILVEIGKKIGKKIELSSRITIPRLKIPEYSNMQYILDYIFIATCLYDKYIIKNYLIQNIDVALCSFESTNNYQTVKKILAYINPLKMGEYDLDYSFYKDSVRKKVPIIIGTIMPLITVELIILQKDPWNMNNELIIKIIDLAIYWCNLHKIDFGKCIVKECNNKTLFHILLESLEDVIVKRIEIENNFNKLSNDDYLKEHCKEKFALYASLVLNMIIICDIDPNSSYETSSEPHISCFDILERISRKINEHCDKNSLDKYDKKFHDSGKKLIEDFKHYFLVKNMINGHLPFPIAEEIIAQIDIPIRESNLFSIN